MSQSVVEMCIDCHEQPKYVSEWGRHDSRCEKCMKAHRTKLRQARFQRQLGAIDQEGEANDAASPSRAGQATYAETELAPATARRDVLGESRVAQSAEDAQAAKAERDATALVLYRLALMGDEAGRLVQEGVADAFRISADVPTGVTFDFTARRTPDDAE